MTDGERPGFLSVGQEAARTIALRSAQQGRLHRTLLVHGARGSGADSFVEDLLALLLCSSADRGMRPCNACVGCRGARSRSHPDLVLGSMERWRELKGSNESIVAAARRWLGESAGAPVVAERRILLIEGVDRAGEQIQNALLKALEEPAPRQMFILVADDLSALLPTIRSRCQPLRMGPVPRAELVAWLIDHERLPADLADLLARLTGGLSGAALAMARDPDFVTWRRQAQTELLTLLRRGPADRLPALKELLDAAGRRTSTAPTAAQTDEGDEPAARTPASQQRAAALLLVDAWTALARDLLVVAAGLPDLALGIEVLEGAHEAADAIGQRQLATFLRTLRRVQDGLLDNTAPKLAMEIAMLAWPRAGATDATGGAAARTDRAVALTDHGGALAVARR
ncbi:MAG: hypothetical protein ABI534_05130 [Chloroflexota bacterium]